jgi:hypothetical protein
VLLSLFLAETPIHTLLPQAMILKTILVNSFLIGDSQKQYPFPSAKVPFSDNVTLLCLKVSENLLIIFGVRVPLTIS